MSRMDLASLGSAILTHDRLFMKEGMPGVEKI
jgi:hypothetical protein